MSCPRTCSILVLMLVHVGCSSSSDQPPRQENGESHWEARIIYESPGRRLECVIKNEQLIRQLILTPLSNSTKDKNPAKYEIAGEMILRRPTGEQRYYLFAGFRKYKTGGEYYVADLTQLEEHIRDNGVTKLPPRLKKEREADGQ